MASSQEDREELLTRYYQQLQLNREHRRIAEATEQRERDLQQALGSARAHLSSLESLLVRLAQEPSDMDNVRKITKECSMVMRETISALSSPKLAK